MNLFPSSGEIAERLLQRNFVCLHQYSRAFWRPGDHAVFLLGHARFLSACLFVVFFKFVRLVRLDLEELEEPQLQLHLLLRPDSLLPLNLLC